MYNFNFIVIPSAGKGDPGRLAPLQPHVASCRAWVSPWTTHCTHCRHLIVLFRQCIVSVVYLVISPMSVVLPSNPCSAFIEVSQAKLRPSLHFIYCVSVYKNGGSEQPSLWDYFHRTMDTLTYPIVYYMTGCIGSDGGILDLPYECHLPSLCVLSAPTLLPAH